MKSGESNGPAHRSRAMVIKQRVHRAVLAFAGAAIVVLLSGCLNYSVDLAVSKGDHVSGTVILTRQAKPGTGVEVLPSPAPLPSGAPGADASNKVTFPKPVSSTDSIVVTPYSDGTNIGYKIEYQRATFKEAAAFAPLQERGGALVFTRDGDTVTFAANFDLSFDAGTEAQKALLAMNVTATVKLSLPGTVDDSNGTVAGNTVTWTVKPLKINDLAATYTSSAPSGVPSASKASGATGTHDNGISTAWALIGAVALGLIIVGALIFWRRRPITASGPASEQPPGHGGPAARAMPTVEPAHPRCR